MVGVDNFGGKGVGNIWEARFDCDVVIEIEGEAEGIEAWTEVGGGGGDANPKRQMEVGGFHGAGGKRKNFSAVAVVSRAISSRV